LKAQEKGSSISKNGIDNALRLKFWYWRVHYLWAASAQKLPRHFAEPGTSQKLPDPAHDHPTRDLRHGESIEGPSQI
jgi:hypothetical protein